MSEKREEIVGGDTMMVDIAGVGAAVEIASNIEVPTEPIEDSGVVVDIDDSKSKKKRKRKLKNVDFIHSIAEQQDSEDDSKKGQPPGESSSLPFTSTAGTTWAGLPNFLPMKFMQSMANAGLTQTTNSEGQSNATNQKSGESGKMPNFPTFPSYYTPYGPMALIPVPLMPGFQQDGKAMWSQALAQKFPMIFPPNKMSQKSSGSPSSGDSEDVTSEFTKHAPKKDSTMEGEDFEGVCVHVCMCVCARTSSYVYVCVCGVGSTYIVCTFVCLQVCVCVNFTDHISSTCIE